MKTILLIFVNPSEKKSILNEIIQKKLLVLKNNSGKWKSMLSGKGFKRLDCF